MWVTQYALTRGVYVVEDGDYDPARPAVIFLPVPGSNRLQAIHRPHWYVDEGDARRRARMMIRAQRLLLLKKLTHLDRLDAQYESAPLPALPWSR